MPVPTTTTMENIERAYELGRAAERQKMADLASIMSNQKLAELTGAVTPRTMAGSELNSLAAEMPGPMSGSGSRKRLGRKAPVIARGVKTQSAPKAKGVKKAIISLIAAEGVNGGIATSGILAKLGFKGTTINATLVGLKKKGLIMQDGKLWLPAPGNASNSETAFDQTMIS